MANISGAKYDNRTASGIVKSGVGKVFGIIVNSHTSGTFALNDGLSSNDESANKATVTLTLTGAIVAGVHAESKVTVDTIANGNEIEIGDITYTARTALSTGPTIPYEVLIGVSDATFLDNLKSAINGTAGAGTTYSTGTVAHPLVIATTNADATQVVVSRTVGIGNNDVVTTGTATRVVWEDTTLGGGTGDSTAGVDGETVTISTYEFAESVLTASGTISDGDTVTIGDKVYTAKTALSSAVRPNEVLIGVSTAVFLDNLKSAVNGTAGVGTTYSTGTVAHKFVSATTNTDTTQKFVAIFAGEDYNSLATLETGANLSWADTTLGGGTTTSNPAHNTVDSQTYTFVTALSEATGATAVPNQILFGASSATALDNLKLAITGGATEGTEYSTGTSQTTLVTATTNADTTQIFEALVAGVEGNYIAVSDTIANGAFGTDTLIGGVDATILITTTYTLPAGPQIITFPEPIEFSTGLYLVVGGTLDCTVLYA